MTEEEPTRVLYRKYLEKATADRLLNYYASEEVYGKVQNALAVIDALPEAIEKLPQLNFEVLAWYSRKDISTPISSLVNREPTVSTLIDDLKQVVDPTTGKTKLDNLSETLAGAFNTKIADLVGIHGNLVWYGNVDRVTSANNLFKISSSIVDTANWLTVTPSGWPKNRQAYLDYIIGLDFTKYLTSVSDLDASKITFGVIDVKRIPALPYLTTIPTTITDAVNWLTDTRKVSVDWVPTLNLRVDGLLSGLIPNWGGILFNTEWDGYPSITLPQGGEIRIHGSGALGANLRLDGSAFLGGLDIGGLDIGAMASALKVRADEVGINWHDMSDRLGYLGQRADGLIWLDNVRGKFRDYISDAVGVSDYLTSKLGNNLSIAWAYDFWVGIMHYQAWYVDSGGVWHQGSYSGSGRNALDTWLTTVRYEIDVHTGNRPNPGLARPLEDALITFIQGMRSVFSNFFDMHGRVRDWSDKIKIAGLGGITTSTVGVGTLGLRGRIAEKLLV